MNETQNHLGSELRTREVWGRNVTEEMARLKECHKRYPLIAFDTEYPGIIHQTYIDSSDEESYIAMKANVESTKLIQCGFTLFNDKGEIGDTWEVNFSNFGDPSDLRNEISIEFLRKHGLDLNKIRNEGIDMFSYRFFPKLLSLFHSQKQLEFITFQGAYDFAYFLCILNNGKLPETRREFASEVAKVFGVVYDLKVFGVNFGLSKLAHLLKIERVGKAHHAGSDSLMTALAFIKLKQVFEDWRFAKGMLYGIGKNVMVIATNTTPKLSSIQHNLVSYPSSNVSIHNGYIPSYDPQQVLWNPTTVQWISYNGMYHQLNHLPSSTFTYPSQTPYAGDYLGPLPNLLQY